MLAWFEASQVHQVDVAVRRAAETMLWHAGLALDDLPVSWLAAENVRRSDVYIRPARDRAWPVLFLDDVAVRLALTIIHHYSALVVRTSVAGGCHVWLASCQPLDEPARRIAQSWLAAKVLADPASISGEHLGRLAGFKNWKRGGEWVNVLAAVTSKPLWSPPPELLREANSSTGSKSHHRVGSRARPHTAPDATESGREWGWVCRAIEAGHDPESIYQRLVSRARPRRGADAERYARRTIEEALRRLDASR